MNTIFIKAVSAVVSMAGSRYYPKGTRFFTVLLATVLSAGYAQAQFHPGVRVGLNGAAMSGDAVPVFWDDAKTSGRVGFIGGFVGELELGKNFAVQPSVLFAQQGYTVLLENGDTKREADYLLNYIQVPLNALAKLNIGQRSNIFFQIGPYVGYALNGKLKLAAYEDGKKTDEEKHSVAFGTGKNEDTMKRLDYGLGFGLGFQTGGVQIDLAINMGLQNLSNTADINLKNFGLLLNVGYFIGK
jgi:hypothetical protein